MWKKIIPAVATLLILVPQWLLGQNELPREYVPAEEMVSLNSNLDFIAALDLISEYSVRFTGKPLFDPTRQEGAIGIEIATMPWEKALQAILSRRGLWYAERDHFYQIVTPSEKDKANEKIVPDDINFRPGNREVKIETIFFEGDRKALSEIGIDWTSFYHGKVDLTASQMSALNVSEDLFSTIVKIPKSLFSVDVKVLLKVLDSKNIGRVIAQPQVTVTESNEGKIQVGQDFSIKTRDFAGNLIDRFFSTGTILQVTPYLYFDEAHVPVIFLKAHVERSQAFPDVVSTIIKKSEANSYVQLFDAEETMIAGLYSTENNHLRKGVPILKDLPWWFGGLRYLFGYERMEEVQKELIIILKASLLPEVFTRLQDFKSSPKSGGPEEKLNRFRQPFIKPNNGFPNGSTTPKPPSKLEEQTAQEQKLPSAPKTVEKYSSKPDQGPAQAEIIPIQKQEQGRDLLKVQDEKTNKPNVMADFPDFAPIAKSEASQSRLAEKVIYRGTIRKVLNDMVVIEWNKGPDPARLPLQDLTVFRREPGRKEYKAIGKVEMVRTMEFRTVAKGANADNADSAIQPGDQVVVQL
jgi:type IV pilus assembly protein PilQ